MPLALQLGAVSDRTLTRSASRGSAGEIMERLPLRACPCHGRNPAALHDAYGLHLNNVIAKRLGISAGD
jgi:hypothetical protein